MSQQLALGYFSHGAIPSTTSPYATNACVTICLLAYVLLRFVSLGTLRRVTALDVAIGYMQTAIMQKPGSTESVLTISRIIALFRLLYAYFPLPISLFVPYCKFGKHRRTFETICF